MLFKDDQLDDEVKDIMLYITGASTDRKGNINVKNKDIVNTEDYLDHLIRDNQNNLSKDINHYNNIKNINLTTPDIRIQNLKSLNIANNSC